MKVWVEFTTKTQLTVRLTWHWQTIKHTLVLYERHDHKQCEIKNLICVHVGMVIIGEAGKSMKYAVNI